jgi:RNA polymerase sigma-70 factor (ECF subfamily)
VSDPDELETLAAARAGDHEAGARLVLRHGPSMMRTGWSVVGRWDAAEVEDVVQEALIAALTTEALPHGDLGAWLRAIVVRKALDHARRASRRSEVDFDAEAESRSTGDFPETDEVLAVRAAFARLSPADRAVLTLVDVEGFSMAEAARALGATTMAVKWRAVRARRRLRAALSGDEP